MTAKILDGKILASRLKDALKKEVDELKKKTSRVPVLAVIRVGQDPAALAYGASQKKTSEALGIDFHVHQLPGHSKLSEIVKTIHQLNADKNVSGIMIHKPLPADVDEHVVFNEMDPLKDVEGMHESNLGKLISGSTKILPCTAASVMEHIRSTGVKIRGREAVIIGRSEIVGKPLALLLLQESATVTICHTGTQEAGTLQSHVRRADIVVAAVGKPNFIKGEWIKEGAIVIDVGINKTPEGLVGDVEYQEASKHAAFITPVPGGVGPVTAVILMKNTIEAFKIQHNI